jgi:predicted ATP-grasp superfamily ATP-dependent carboligase
MKTRCLSVLMLDGESSFAHNVAHCLARRPNVALHVVSTSRSVPLRYSRLRSSFIVSEARSDAERLQALPELVARTGADVLLAVDGASVRFVSEHYGCLKRLAAIAPVPETGTFDAVNDKGRLAELAAKLGVPHPPTICIAGSERPGDRVLQLPFPVLLKPCHGGNGANIRSFEEPAELSRFLRDGQGPPGRSIVQSYVPGYDIDCNVLCERGTLLAYTIQKGFIPASHPFGPPGGVDFLADEQTLEVVKAFVAGTQWTGVAHIDLRYDQREKRTKLIEVNPRYWGSLLGSLEAGVNFPYFACQAALNAPFPPPRYNFVRFVSGESAIRHWARRFSGEAGASVPFRATALKYVCADPAPTVFELIRRVSKRIGGSLGVRFKAGLRVRKAT